MLEYLEMYGIITFCIPKTSLLRIAIKLFDERDHLHSNITVHERDYKEVELIESLV